MKATWAESSPRWIASAVDRSCVNVRSGSCDVTSLDADTALGDDEGVGDLVAVRSVGDDLLQDERGGGGDIGGVRGGVEVVEPRIGEKPSQGARTLPPTPGKSSLGRSRYVRHMQEIGRGAKVFDAAPVRGRCLPMDGPDDVLALMDTGADGVVALVRDAGATFLAPIYHELTGIICTSGTLSQPHRDREPRVPGAVRDGLQLQRRRTRGRGRGRARLLGR